MKTKLYLLKLIFLLSISYCYSQNTTLTPQGVMFPQLSTTQINALTGQAKGTMVFDNIINQMKYWDGLAWQSVTNGGSGGAWQSSGSDQIASNSGNIGIGTSSPNTKLEVSQVANNTELRVSSEAGFGSSAISFVSDKGKVSEWRPGLIRSGDNGQFSGRLDFITNGDYENNRFDEVMAMSVTEGRVGVGLVSPLVSLDVNGPILTRSRLYLAPLNGPDPAVNPVWAVDTYNDEFRVFRQSNIYQSGTTYLSLKNSGILNIEVGKINSSTTGNSNLLPIAFGRADGKGSNNFTVTPVYANGSITPTSFEINVSGYNLNETDFTVFANPLNQFNAARIEYTFINGKLIISGSGGFGFPTGQFVNLIYNCGTSSCDVRYLERKYVGQEYPLEDFNFIIYKNHIQTPN